MKTSELKTMMLEITKDQGLDILHQSIAQIDYKEPIRVAFLGKFSTGKSTLINALLKQRIIPMLDKPTNANPIEVSPASEDRFEVLQWIDDKEKISEIQRDDLLHEVVTFELGKRIYIYLKNTDILSDDVVIIDTPGISSILEHHTQVTYGYLPLIDAAVFLISAIPGEATASIINFIQREISPIEGLKDRLFFCVTMLDTLPPDTREKVYKQIQESLKNVIPNARVVALSPKQILEYATNNDMDSYYESGIGTLIDFIKVYLPDKREHIMNEKLCKHLRALKEPIISQLEAKRVSLDYSTTDLDKEIEKAQDQIENLKRKISQFNSEVEKTENRIMDQIRIEQELLVDAIAYKASNDMEFTDDINSFSESVKGIIINNYSNIDIPTVSDKVRLGDIINSKLSPEVNNIKRCMDLSANVITTIATVFIPGKTAADATGAAAVAAKEIGEQAGKEVAEKVAKQAVRKAKLLKVLAFVGKVIDEINPIENVKDLIEFPLLKARIKSKLCETMRQVLESIFNIIHNNISVYIDENFTKNIRQHSETLNRIRKVKSERIEDLDNVRGRIKIDIQRLKDNNC